MHYLNLMADVKEDDDRDREIAIKSLHTGFNKESEDFEENPASDEEARPEDAIPDLPENREAREFLKKAPTKGLVSKILMFELKFDLNMWASLCL